MREAYVQRDNPSFEAQLERRTADLAASALLPHLRPGMRLLDVGCGPGSITLDLAAVVAPGAVVGIDIQPALVERARELADERGTTNVRFEVADVNTLDIEAQFDAAFAHMVLMHLPDPVGVLTRIRRALTPSGVIGVLDPDLGTTVRWPSSPVWERFLELRLRAHEHQGSDGRIGRKHREVLRAAGFARTEGRARTRGQGTAEQTHEHARWLKTQIVGFGRIAIAEGWADRSELDAMAADIDAWAERPDAFFFTVICETLGWVRA
jgi:ubiquinone/menaquinone biosynthesis C-methylase UbiE